MGFCVNVNGRLTPVEQATISVVDRGFLYGDSVYEVMRTYGGKLFGMTEHLDRLECSAERLDIRLPPRDELIAEIERTVAHGANQETYCRVIVTRGEGPITLDPTAACGTNLVIFAKPLEPFALWMYQRGIRVFVARIQRTAKEATDPGIKSGNYLNSVLAFGEARRAGFDEALMLDRNGRVTEGTSWNVFAVQRGALLTPPLDAGILAGVTRHHLFEISAEQGISCREQELTVEDLAASDEVLATSTLREVMPVVQVGPHAIGAGTPGPQASRLRAWLTELGQGGYKARR